MEFWEYLVSPATIPVWLLWFMSFMTGHALGLWIAKFIWR